MLTYLDDCLNSKKTKSFLGDSKNVLSREDSKKLIYRYANCISQFENKDDFKQLSIVIYLPRNVDYLASIFAIWKSGHYYIPLNTNWPPEHVEKVLNHLKPDLIIADESLKSHFS